MEIPDRFICPLSNRIFLEPVVCQDNYVYEKELIEKWLSVKPISPITNEPMYKQVEDCIQLKDQIDTFLTLYPQHRNFQYKKNQSYFWIKIIFCILGFPIIITVAVIFFIPFIFGLLSLIRQIINMWS